MICLFDRKQSESLLENCAKQRRNVTCIEFKDLLYILGDWGDQWLCYVEQKLGTNVILNLLLKFKVKKKINKDIFNALWLCYVKR